MKKNILISYSVMQKEEIHGMTREKSRHGCLTVWLNYMIVANSLVVFISIRSAESIKLAMPNAPVTLVPILTVLCIFNIICAFAIYRWKKWGFWGFLASSVALLVIKLSVGLGWVQSFRGLAGIAILYEILNIGESNKGWSQLE